MKSNLKRFVVSASLVLLTVIAQAGSREDIQAAMKAGQWSRADERLDEVLRKHPDNALAHYWRAEVRYKLGKIEDAQAEVHRAREIDPTEKFASDKTLLSQIMRASAKADLQTLQPHSPVVAVQAPLGESVRLQADTTLPHPVRARKSGFGFGAVALLLAAAVGVVAWRVARARGNDDKQRERARWKDALSEAHKDLGDAVAASDANPQNTPETRLANYDRARKTQADLLAHQNSLASRTEFAEAQSLATRAHDIAAEIRGEERPSDRVSRLEQERQVAAAAANGQVPLIGGYGVQQPTPGLGGGLLGTVAAVGAGAVIGSLLSGAAQARPHQTGNNEGTGYVPFDSDTAQAVDVGGANAGSDAWDTRSADVDAGGDGDGSFD